MLDLGDRIEALIDRRARESEGAERTQDCRHDLEAKHHGEAGGGDALHDRRHLEQRVTGVARERCDGAADEDDAEEAVDRVHGAEFLLRHHAPRPVGEFDRDRAESGIRELRAERTVERRTGSHEPCMTSDDANEEQRCERYDETHSVSPCLPAPEWGRTCIHLYHIHDFLSIHTRCAEYQKTLALFIKVW